MKNLLKISLVAIALFTASLAVAADDETFTLQVKSDRQKSIAFNVDQTKDVEFSIYNENSDLLYAQKIHTDLPATKTYNLDAFPDGNYQVKLETAAKITQYQIQIVDGKTLVGQAVVTQKFKPVITKENSMIILAMEDVAGNPVEVSVLNEYSDKLYTEVFKEKSKFTKKFNIGQTDAKELTFIVKVKGQEYVETVTIK